MDDAASLRRDLRAAFAAPGVSDIAAAAGTARLAALLDRLSRADG